MEEGHKEISSLPQLRCRQEQILLRPRMISLLLVVQWILIVPQFHLAFTPPSHLRNAQGCENRKKATKQRQVIQMNYHHEPSQLVPTNLTDSSAPAFPSSDDVYGIRNASIKDDVQDHYFPSPIFSSIPFVGTADDGEKSTTQLYNVELEQLGACEQVGAILDLYNSTIVDNQNDSCEDTMPPTAISKVVVSKAIEGLILRILHDDRTILIDDNILNQVESLFWRSYDELHIIPSHRSLDALWHLYQRNWASLNNRLQKKQQHHPKQQQKLHAGKHIGRCVNLLRKWTILSKSDISLSLEAGNKIPSSPPYEYIHAIFALADEKQRTMSCNLWSLYRGIRFSGLPPRSLFDMVLRILSNSSIDWKVKQCLVLQDMEILHRQSTNIHVVNSIPQHERFAPNLYELDRALRHVSKAGKAPEATWLFRMIVRRQQQQQQQQQQRQMQTNTLSSSSLAVVISDRHFFAWYVALCNSPDQSSTFYLERLLDSAVNSHMDGNRRQHLRCTYCYHLLVKRYIKSNTPGAGFRAEQLFKKLATCCEKDSDNLSFLRPNETTVNLVVQCYIQSSSADNHSRTTAALQDIMDACNFVKQSVPNLPPMVDNDCSRTMNGGSKRANIMFQQLLGRLEAYAGDSPEAATKGKDLFRFFLVQYKQRRVSETPNESHAQHVVDAMQKQGASEKEIEKVHLDLCRLINGSKNTSTPPPPPRTFEERKREALHRAAS